MFSVEHASSMGPAVMEEGRRRRRGEQQASCLVAKQAMEFPQVLASGYNFSYYYSAHFDRPHSHASLSLFLIRMSALL